MSRNTPLSSPLLTCRQVCIPPTAHLGTHPRVHLYSPADRFVYLLQHVSEHTPEFTFTHLQTGLYTYTSRNTPLSSPLLTCRQVCKPTACLGTHLWVHLYSPADRFVYLLQHISEHTPEFTFTHLQTGLYTYSTSRNTPPSSPLLTCRQVCIYTYKI